MAIQAGLPARAAALDILHAILTTRTPLEQVLEGSRAVKSLPSSDRAFTRLLVATTLRRLGEIDSTLAKLLKKPPAAKAEKVRYILRLGVSQLVFLETPPHAAVDTSVNLARSIGLGGFSGLINAVLRRVVGTRPLEGEAAAIANTPEWLWRSWVDSYGETTAAAIAQAHLKDPPLDLTLKLGASVEAAALNAIQLPTGSLRILSTGNPTDLPGFTDGAFWVQDAAAALPARLIPAPAGKRIIDLCAAPGGKTAQLAAAGADVVAVERSGQRLQRLQENLGRLGLTAEAVNADAVTWRPDQPADAVLLDAPCTATGTIRRHPDIPHLKRPEDPVRLSQTQARLLDAAAEMARPGGIVIYAVCSLQPEEGPAVVDAFLARNRQFSRSPIDSDDIPGISDFITQAGDLRTLPAHWPDRGGLDGFFAARLRRS